MNNQKNKDPRYGGGNGGGKGQGGILPTEGSGEMRHDTMSRPAIPKNKNRRRARKQEKSFWNTLGTFFGAGNEEETMASYLNLDEDDNDTTAPTTTLLRLY